MSAQTLIATWQEQELTECLLVRPSHPPAVTQAAASLAETD